MLLIQKREIGVSICNLPVGITEAHIREIIELTGIFKNDNPQPGEVVVFPKDFNIKVLEPFKNKHGYSMCRAEVKLDTSDFIDEDTGVERRLTITECLAVEAHIINSFNVGIFVNITSLGAMAIAMPGPDALFLGDGHLSHYYHRYKSRGREFRQSFLRMRAEAFKIKSVDLPPKSFKAVEKRHDKAEVVSQAQSAEISIQLEFGEAVRSASSVEEVQTILAPLAPVLTVEQEQALEWKKRQEQEIDINLEQVEPELQIEIKV